MDGKIFLCWLVDLGLLEQQLDYIRYEGDPVRIETNLTTAILRNLSPGHVYRISVMAVNSAGSGDRVKYTVSTATLPPVQLDTTTVEQTSMDMTTMLLQSKEDNSTVLSPAIFGGIIAGAVFVVIMVILVTCLCIKRKRQDHARYVNSKNSEVFGNLDHEQSLRTQKHSEERGSLRRIDFTGDGVQYGTNNKQSKENPKISTLEVPRTKLINNTESNSVNGIENPGYRKEQNPDTESIAVSMTLSSEDLFSQADSTIKRTSRMRSESAAAIAVMRNSRLPRLPRSMDDTDTLINHDSVVIYTERTAL